LTNATIGDTSNIPSGGVLNINTDSVNLNTNSYLRFYNGATLNGNIDFGGNLTTSGAINTTGGITTNTLTSSGVINANGGIKVNNYSIPLFNNGTFSGTNTIVIPVLFTSSSYNHCEIRIQYAVSAICNIVLSGNTASNGSGTSLAVSENGETTVQNTAQNTPIYTTTGVIATNNTALSIYNQFKMTITKGNGQNRNYYSFDTVYSWNGVGTARVYGMGHMDSSTLASVVLTLSGGNTSGGTYSTVHYY
jgi:hypothetical protein